VILDECLPKRFGRELAGHNVTTVAQAGFAGVKNGELLRRLVGAIDAFITVDKNLPSQQQISAISFGVVILRTPSNRLEDLQPLVPDVLAGLASLKPGDVVYFGRT
jgi:hypothetical protein